MSEKEPVRRNLEAQPTDYVASAAKAIVGAAPIVGSLLSELAGTLIPNQRLDRIAKFAKELEGRLAALDQMILKNKLTDENATDLLEEGLRQAARSLSDERRRYLASVVANGIDSQDIEYFESKHVLRILGELNDVEIIWLRSYLVRTMDGDKEFREKHKEVLRPIPMVMASPDPIRDKAALQKSYKNHLVRLGLLRERYDTNPSKGPELDMSGELKVRGYDLTGFGQMVLRQIGLLKGRM
ncbi:MAG: hypothetical protein AAB576_09845 [Elusimicrobiota bacterium]